MGSIKISKTAGQICAVPSSLQVAVCGRGDMLRLKALDGEMPQVNPPPTPPPLLPSGACILFIFESASHIEHLA